MGNCNGVLVLTRNNLALNKRCIESIQGQDIPIYLFVFDNGSTDGTSEWLVEQGFAGMAHPENKGVSYGWNVGLEFLFEDPEVNQVLVLNSDTVLPPWFYGDLLGYGTDDLTGAPVSFVTGVSVGSMDEIATPPPVKDLVEAPDFSAFMILREAWETIGEFDESMVHYASDLDYHIRAWRKGIHLWNAGIPFYHERSSTLNLATPKDRRMIQLQADADRERLTEKWGCRAGDDSYKAMFSPDTFGVDANHEVSKATNER